MKTFRHLIIAVVAAAALAATACGSDTPATTAAGNGASATAATAQPRPAALAAYPEMTLHGPIPVNAGHFPIFSWEPVVGATQYRLTVLAEDGLLWAWTGPETEVRLGGYEDEPSPAFDGPRLDAPAYWSVVALDDAGLPVAASAMRPVAPDTSAPAFQPGQRTVTTDLSGGAESGDTPSEPSGPLVACDLLTDDEADAFLHGEAVVPAVAAEQQGGAWTSCEWAHASDELLSIAVSVNRKEGAWNPTQWAGDDYTTVDGLGEDSFVYSDWGGTRVGFLRDGATIYLTSGYGESAQAPMIELARKVDARLQGQDG